MEIVKTYGQAIEKLSEKNPSQAQKLLKLGWQVQNLKFRLFPNKQLMPADRYLAGLMMNTMIAPLKDPGHSAIVSIFTPCELLAAGRESGHIGDSLQLSQSILRGGSERNSAETEVYCIYQSDLRCQSADLSDAGRALSGSGFCH